MIEHDWQVVTLADIVLTQASRGTIEVTVRDSETGGAVTVVDLKTGATRVIAQDPSWTALDGLAVAKVLAGELKKGTFDLIVAGHRAVDDDNFQVVFEAIKQLREARGVGRGDRLARCGEGKPSHPELVPELAPSLLLGQPGAGHLDRLAVDPHRQLRHSCSWW